MHFSTFIFQKLFVVTIRKWVEDHEARPSLFESRTAAYPAKIPTSATFVSGSIWVGFVQGSANSHA